MKKTILTLMACVMAVSVMAGGTNSASLFKANEFSAKLDASFALVNKTPVLFSPGLSYFATKNLGIEGSLPVYQTETGRSFDRVNFGGVIRVPIGIVAPYARAGTEYNWKTRANVRDWAGYVGGGLEARINKSWGVYGGANYNFTSFASRNQGVWSPNVGVRLIFW